MGELLDLLIKITQWLWIPMGGVIAFLLTGRQAFFKMFEKLRGELVVLRQDLEKHELRDEMMNEAHQNEVKHIYNELKEMKEYEKQSLSDIKKQLGRVFEILDKQRGL